MAGLDDVFGKNANRPDHPDFWRISEIILSNDGAMEAVHNNNDRERVWKERVDAVVDRNSITYMAVQRTRLAFALNKAGAAFQLPAAEITPQQLATIASLVIDAFVAGAQFEQRGGHQEK